MNHKEVTIPEFDSEVSEFIGYLSNSWEYIIAKIPQVSNLGENMYIVPRYLQKNEDYIT